MPVRRSMADQTAVIHLPRLGLHAGTAGPSLSTWASTWPVRSSLAGCRPILNFLKLLIALPSHSYRTHRTHRLRLAGESSLCEQDIGTGKSRFQAKQTVHRTACGTADLPPLKSPRPTSIYRLVRRPASDFMDNARSALCD